MEHNMNIFRATSIRGVYGKDLDEKTAELIGKAYGTFLGSGKTVGVARDFRISGGILMKNFIAGLNSVGCDVIDLGVLTTPMLYFAVRKLKLDAGAVVTASHNPGEWNGFKLTDGNGMLYAEENGMLKIKELFQNQKFHTSTRSASVKKVEVFREYKEFILSKVNSKRRLKIILDPGNGTACNVAGDLFVSAGHEVIVINGHPDGSFPSRPSEPTEENIKALREEVVRQKADIGMAFDGDSDRIALIDNMGRYVSSGNIMIPIFSEYYLGKTSGGKIVYDICCSSFVEEHIRKLGGTPIVTKVGQYFIQNKMNSEKAVFGGEYSSHINFAEIFGFDDAIFAGLKIAEIISSGERSLADLVNTIPQYPASKVLEIPCDDHKKFDVVKRIAKRLEKEGYRILDIDGVKAYDENNDWMLIRGSNTLPVIKINSEAKSESRMKELFNYANKVVKEEIEK